MTRFQNTQTLIDRMVARPGDYAANWHQLQQNGIAPYSAKMAEILRLDYTAEFVSLHIQVWQIDGAGVGALIYRLCEGWQPDIEKLENTRMVIDQLAADIAEEESYHDQPLTADQIVQWFGHYREKIPDQFDQLILQRGGNPEAAATSTERHSRNQVPAEYADLIQR